MGKRLYPFDDQNLEDKPPLPPKEKGQGNDYSFLVVTTNGMDIYTNSFKGDLQGRGLKI